VSYTESLGNETPSSPELRAEMFMIALQNLAMRIRIKYFFSQHLYDEDAPPILILLNEVNQDRWLEELQKLGVISAEYRYQKMVEWQNQTAISPKTTNKNSVFIFASSPHPDLMGDLVSELFFAIDKYEGKINPNSYPELNTGWLLDLTKHYKTLIDNESFMVVLEVVFK